MKNLFNIISNVLKGFYLYIRNDHLNGEMKSFYFANKKHWGKDKNSNLNSNEVCLVDGSHIIG